MLTITTLITEINGGPEPHQGFAPSQIVLAERCGCNFPDNCQTLSAPGNKQLDIKLISFIVTFTLILGENPFFISNNFLQSRWGEPSSGC